MKKRTTAMTLYQINMDVKFSAYTDKQFLTKERKKEKKMWKKTEPNKRKIFFDVGWCSAPTHCYLSGMYMKPYI